MNSKSDRLAHRKKDEKKSGEVRRYAHISADSITTAADSIGISNLSEDVPKRLADDVSYKLREIIHKCAVYLRHANRSKLIAEDVNNVLQLSDAPRCYGYPPCENLKYTYVKEARVFVAEDEEVDLINFSLRSEVYLQPDECYVKGKWIFPDKPVGEKPLHIKSEEPANLNANNSVQVFPQLLDYYKQISKSLLGKSKKLFQVAVNDLKSNPNISPVAPLLVNLIAAYIHHHRANGIKIYCLLQAVDSLLQNKYVDLRASDKSNTLVTSLLLFIINPSQIHGKSTLDDILLRKTASRMMLKILKIWHPLEVVLCIEIYYNLTGTLLNSQNSLYSHLGALYAMISFGSEALDKCFWPNLMNYLAILEEAEKAEIVEDMKGAILAAAEILFVKNCESNNAREAVVYKCDVEVQNQLRDYFGDSLCARYRCAGSPGNTLDSPREKPAGGTGERIISEKDGWMRSRSMKSFRCLPYNTVSRFKHPVTDWFESVACDNNEVDLRRYATHVGTSVGRSRVPQRIFQFHNLFSSTRCIGKMGKKNASLNLRNIS
ncbi:hypothetical protein J437_LFUL007349, partial [Ladona fulva]